MQVGKKMVAVGMAVAGSLQLASSVTTLCSVRKKSPGKVTTFLRENNIGWDAVEAAVLRKKMKARKKEKKARAQANKMSDFDVAQETVLAPTVAALNAEIATYGKRRSQCGPTFRNNTKADGYYAIESTIQYLPHPSFDKE